MAEDKVLYGSFSEWVKQREDFASDLIHELSLDGARNWYKPIGYTEGGESNGGKDVSVLDVEKTEERFNRKDIQDAYSKFLQEKEKPVSTGKITNARYQSAPIAASERAFRHRHLTPCRAMILGAVPLLKTANSNTGKVLIAVANYLYTQGEPQV